LLGSHKLTKEKKKKKLTLGQGGPARQERSRAHGGGRA
jgi:hypothetical protein